MDKQVKVCDRCEAFEAEAREADLDDVNPPCKADLCDTCWRGVLRAVKRAMSKPVTRKGADNASAA